MSNQSCKQQVDLIVDDMEKISKKFSATELIDGDKQTDTRRHQKNTSKTSLANNNDDHFISEYPANDPLSSPEPLPANDGRISGGSNQPSSLSGSSAFYEDADDSPCPSSGSSQPSSGRSSAADSIELQAQQPDGQTISPTSNSLCKVLNPNSNLPEQSEKFYTMVDTIRIRFLESLEETDEQDGGNPAKAFDEADLEELRKPLPPMSKQEESLTFRIISRYLTNNKLFEKKPVKDCKDELIIDEAIQRAVENLTGFLKFRNQYKLTRVLEEEFSREFYIMNGAFIFGHDRRNIPILYLRAKIHRRWTKSLDESLRRYLSWQLNKITKSEHGVQVTKTIGLNQTVKDGSFGICFDCADVGYSSLDLDFLRFIVNLLIHYYPSCCRYALCVDLPWLFRSVWKLVRSWLPEEARETVQLITSKQLVEFIDENQIPNSFKINDMKASEKPIANKHSLPKNWSSIKGIEELATDMNLSSSEIKQFKAHVEKLKKEYESLGAL